MGSIAHTPMHVLEVIGNAHVGGVENHVFSLAQRLPEFGIKVTCLAPYESAYTARLRGLGVNVFPTEMHVHMPWKSIQLAQELISQQNVDVVHSHLPRAHLLAGLAARLTNRPAVATFHGMEVGMEEFGIAKMTGMHMVTVCQQAYSQVLALGMPAEMVHLVHNGVDLDVFVPRRKAAAYRQKNGIPTDALLVGFAGRLSYEKGPDQFVQVAEIVHRARPDIHFAMAGDGPMRDELRVLADRSGLAEVLHMTGLSESMAGVYPAFDIFAMTSRIEGMPLAALEAMACGVPIVAMSVGGLLEAVEVGTTGLTSAAEDVKGLAHAVLLLAGDAERMKKMGEAAHRRAANLFGLQPSVSSLADLLRNLTGYALPGSLLHPKLVVPETAEDKARVKPVHAKRK